MEMTRTKGTTRMTRTKGTTRRNGTMKRGNGEDGKMRGYEAKLVK